MAKISLWTEAALPGKTCVFDLDGTLCTTVGTDYELSEPIVSRIALVNQMFDDGWTIIIFTARGTLSGIDYLGLTRKQLSTWGVKHHQLILGKPAADLYVDDKGVSDISFFEGGLSPESQIGHRNIS